jgi:hypothetical protein
MNSPRAPGWPLAPDELEAERDALRRLAGGRCCATSRPPRTWCRTPSPPPSPGIGGPWTCPAGCEPWCATSPLDRRRRAGAGQSPGAPSRAEGGRGSRVRDPGPAGTRRMPGPRGASAPGALQHHGAAALLRRAFAATDRRAPRGSDGDGGIAAGSRPRAAAGATGPRGRKRPLAVGGRRLGPSRAHPFQGDLLDEHGIETGPHGGRAGPGRLGLVDLEGRGAERRLPRRGARGGASAPGRGGAARGPAQREFRAHARLREARSRGAASGTRGAAPGGPRGRRIGATGGRGGDRRPARRGDSPAGRPARHQRSPTAASPWRRSPVRGTCGPPARPWFTLGPAPYGARALPSERVVCIAPPRGPGRNRRGRRGPAAPRRARGDRQFRRHPAGARPCRGGLGLRAGGVDRRTGADTASRTRRARAVPGCR